MKNYNPDAKMYNRYGTRIYCSYDENYKIDDETKNLIDNNQEHAFVIDKYISLNWDMFEQVCELGDNGNILIDLKPDEIYTKEEIEILQKNISKANNKNFNVEFMQGFTLEQAKTASKRIEDWAEQINNTKFEGNNLSPLEKYLMAYQIATQFVYKLEKNREVSDKSRSVNYVFGDEKVDKIVCVGFASLLKCLCDKIGIESVVSDVNTEGKNYADHVICKIKISDAKYGIFNAIYCADPTNDSYGRNATTINFSLMEPNALSKMFGGNSTIMDFFMSEEDLYYNFFNNDEYKNRYVNYQEFWKNEYETSITNKYTNAFADVLKDLPEYNGRYITQKQEESLMSEVFSFVQKLCKNEIENINELQNDSNFETLFNNEIEDATKNKLYKFASKLLSKYKISKQHLNETFTMFLSGMSEQYAYDYCEFARLMGYSNFTSTIFKNLSNNSKHIDADIIARVLHNVNLANGMKTPESIDRITKLFTSSILVGKYDDFKPNDFRFIKQKINGESVQSVRKNIELVVKNYLRGGKPIAQLVENAGPTL